MNYNSLMNKPTINYRELIGDNTVSEVGGITEDQFDQLLDTDLSSYYNKAQIDELFSRSYVYREKSGSIVTFNCPASVNGIDKVISEIVAVQSGTGDPSPTNVRPITGWSAVNVAVSPTTDAEDGTTYTTTLKDGQGNPMTCYGGELSNENGVQTLTNETKIIVLDGSENWATDIVGNKKRRFTCASLIDLGVTTTTTFDAISNIYVNTKSASYIDLSEVFILRYLSQYNQNRIDIMTEAYQDVASFKAFLNSTNMQIVYELTTPQTIPQDSLSIATQEGTNNLWADSGDINEGSYFVAI